jgi:hypothetical protein
MEACNVATVLLMVVVPVARHDILEKPQGSKE